MLIKYDLIYIKSNFVDLNQLRSSVSNWTKNDFLNSVIFLRFSSIVWCNLNWLLMDVTSLKVPLVLLSSSLHPNHQSREEQRAKRGAHARLSRSKTLEPLPQFFFLVRKKTWATVATAPSRAEKLYKMSWPH